MNSQGRPFSNHGSGTLSILSHANTTRLTFELIDPNIGAMITLKITDERTVLYLRHGGILQAKSERADPEASLELRRKVRYWISFDSRSGIFRYGKYLPNERLTLMKAFLMPGAAVAQGTSNLFWDGSASPVNIKDARVFHQVGNGEERTDLMANYSPLTVQCDPKPCITPAKCLSMSMLAGGDYTALSTLHPACQELYEHISGPEISLDNDDFDFPAAIQHSIDTEGGLIYNLLRQKAILRGEDRVATQEEMATVTDTQLRAQYLRITLGCHKGNSPGVPFVLEIWPGGHHSAIHDHDGACAVIKVLHGEIKCQWYKSLEPARKMDNEITFKRGEITWMSPDHYQIHQLMNRKSQVCCTLQCYQYPTDMDPGALPDGGFHYVNNSGNVMRFEPNSDMAYEDFRARIKEEWNAYRESVRTM